MGEITSVFQPDYDAVAREAIRSIGYTEPGLGFDCDNCRVDTDVHRQSPDIAMGVNRRDAEDTGAGDQGMMFGYACTETPDLMPLPITLAHALAKRLETVRRSGEIEGLRPDGKTQVTVEYSDGKPAAVTAVIVSAQHGADIGTDTLRDSIIEHVIKKEIPGVLLRPDTLFYINPTGRFVTGGPAADSGLTGRKLIVDTYGGSARHGGGSFAGKDPTKVDKSGAYMARYLAKNIVASGLADRCEIQLSYAIGLAEPISAAVCTFGTGRIPDERISGYLTRSVDMRPEMIIRRFGLRLPIYRRISCYGHFGANAAGMPWERTDLAEELKKLC